MNILFVCTGNICRSPTAEHLLRKLAKDAGVKDLKVASAGTSAETNMGMTDEAMDALKGEDVVGIAHSPQGLTSANVGAADLIFAMEGHHRDIVLRRFPAAAGKVHVLKTYAGLPGPSGVDDPYGGSSRDYQTALADIKAALTSIIRKWKA